MSKTQVNSHDAGDYMEGFRGGPPRFLDQGASFFYASGALALLVLGRQIPAELLLFSCVAVALLSFSISKLAASSRSNRELRLRTLLRETRQLYNTVPIGLVVCNGDGVIIDINDTLLEYADRQRQDLIEKGSINELLCSASRKKFWEFVAMSKKNVGWVRNVTLEFKTGSNTSKAMLASICAEFDTSGTHTIKCITADVTEGQETQTSLAETRKTFRRFSEQLENVGVIRCDIEGKINFSNSSACLLLLRRPIDLLGNNISQLYAEQDSSYFQQDMKSAHDFPDRKYSVRRSLTRGNGSSFQGKLSFVTAQTEFGTPGAIVILEDLSEKKMLETWLSKVIATRETTMHLGRCLADMIENLCEMLYVHQPRFTIRKHEHSKDIPAELSDMARHFLNREVFAELLEFSLSTLSLLVHQLNKSIAARDIDNVLMIASLIESIGMKLEFKKLEQSAIELENEISSESWQQIELCAAVVKKEVESIQIAAQRALSGKVPEYATV